MVSVIALRLSSEYLMLPHLHLFFCHSLSFLKEVLKAVTWSLTTHRWPPSEPLVETVYHDSQNLLSSSRALNKFFFDSPTFWARWLLRVPGMKTFFISGLIQLHLRSFSLKAILENILFNELPREGELGILAAWFDRAGIMAQEKYKGSYFKLQRICDLPFCNNYLWNKLQYLGQWDWGQQHIICPASKLICLDKHNEQNL